MSNHPSWYSSKLRLGLFLDGGSKNLRVDLGTAHHFLHSEAEVTTASLFRQLCARIRDAVKCGFDESYKMLTVIIGDSEFVLSEHEDHQGQIDGLREVVFLECAKRASTSADFGQFGFTIMCQIQSVRIPLSRVSAVEHGPDRPRTQLLMRDLVRGITSQFSHTSGEPSVDLSSRDREPDLCRQSDESSNGSERPAKKNRTRAGAGRPRKDRSVRLFEAMKRLQHICNDNGGGNFEVFAPDDPDLIQYLPVHIKPHQFEFGAVVCGCVLKMDPTKYRNVRTGHHVWTLSADFRLSASAKESFSACSRGRDVTRASQSFLRKFLINVPTASSAASSSRSPPNNTSRETLRMTPDISSDN